MSKQEAEFLHHSPHERVIAGFMFTLQLFCQSFHYLRMERQDGAVAAVVKTSGG